MSRSTLISLGEKDVAIVIREDNRQELALPTMDPDAEVGENVKRLLACVELLKDEKLCLELFLRATK